MHRICAFAVYHGSAMRLALVHNRCEIAWAQNALLSGHPKLSGSGGACRRPRVGALRAPVAYGSRNLGAVKAFRHEP